MNNKILMLVGGGLMMMFTPSVKAQTYGGLTQLQSIVLPNGLKQMGNKALRGCTQLKTVTCKAAEAPVCGTEVFAPQITNALTPATLNAGSDAYATAPTWCKFFIKKATALATFNVQADQAVTLQCASLNAAIAYRLFYLGGTGTLTLDAPATLLNIETGESVEVKDAPYCFDAVKQGNYLLQMKGVTVQLFVYVSAS